MLPISQDKAEPMNITDRDLYEAAQAIGTDPQEVLAMAGIGECTNVGGWLSKGWKKLKKGVSKGIKKVKKFAKSPIGKIAMVGAGVLLGGGALAGGMALAKKAMGGSKALKGGFSVLRSKSKIAALAKKKGESPSKIKRLIAKAMKGRAAALKKAKPKEAVKKLNAINSNQSKQAGAQEKMILQLIKTKKIPEATGKKMIAAIRARRAVEKKENKATLGAIKKIAMEKAAAIKEIEKQKKIDKIIAKKRAAAITENVIDKPTKENKIKILEPVT